MNLLEAEYSFLAPTWKLPMVGTSSMFSRVSGPFYSSTNTLDYGPDMSLWNTTRYNTRYVPTYIPPTTVRRNYPVVMNYPTNVSQQQNYQISDARPVQSGPPYYQQTNFNTNSANEQNLTFTVPSNYDQSQNQVVNRGLTYATNNQPSTNQRRRVQIIDQNRQTPSTVVNNDYSSDQSNRNSMNDHTQMVSDRSESHGKTKQSTSNHREENRFGYNGNNFNIHEYLYGLSGPDPGSYASAFKHQQRRLQDEKAGRKSVVNEYRNFIQNGGFGPAFGNANSHTYGEKIESEQKKKTYAKSVRQTNQQKIEEQRRLQNINGQQKKPLPSKPKYQRAKEYAEKIEKPHYLKPVSEKEFLSQIPTIVSPILITSLSHHQRCSSSESVHSTNLSDLVGGEFQINRPRRSSSISSISQKRRVRFHSRDFIRLRSSTILDLPSHINGKGLFPTRLECSSARTYTEKSAAKILDEEEKFHVEQLTTSNEKKLISSPSMTNTKNMRLPPTATVIIHQTSQPSFLPTTSTNSQLKKTFANKDFTSAQRPLVLHSIPRVAKPLSNPVFDFHIKSYHHDDDDDDETILSNE